MHGLFFLEFKRHVMNSMGADTWNSLVKQTGLQDQIFLPDQVYPDPQFQALLEAAANGDDPDTLHEVQVTFGRSIAPRLLHMYGTQINPAWDALDVVENAETTIHRVVRLRDPQADPPRLRSVRTSPNEVVIHYDSPRRLCGVAVGIAQGVSNHYEEEMEIEEEGCTVRGDGASKIHVRRSRIPGAARLRSPSSRETRPLERSGP